jgi:hypothetical protein
MYLTHAYQRCGQEVRAFRLQGGLDSRCAAPAQIAFVSESSSGYLPAVYSSPPTAQPWQLALSAPPYALFGHDGVARSGPGAQQLSHLNVIDVCMHICMYVCMLACMYIRMYVCVCVCMCVCMYVYTYVCMYIRITS